MLGRSFEVSHTAWSRSSMASWLSVRYVLDQLDDDDDGSSADESDFEGEEIAGYLPEFPDILLGGDADGEEQFKDAEEGDDVAGSSGGPAGSDSGRTSPRV